ncbi:hypothetical protein LSTR_LSTR011750 [Laodelphax striatellus]|uniref:C2H2-type domain-containing protein n=1 Tax=Laodelphax striatellus TaxID=195883 RepID=A0A482WM05_LAOST|nr:hypothetical protein LSTR_LSTR011750 [Laodelphax striatellus]
MMNNDSVEENDDDMLNILQCVQIKMENDDDADNVHKDNSTNICKEGLEEVEVKDKEDGETEEDGASEEEEDKEDGEQESEGEIEEIKHDPTNSSTHQPFEQVFIKQEQDSNFLLMDEELYSESEGAELGDEADDETSGNSDPLVTEGIKITESYDDFGRVEYHCVACNMRYPRRDLLFMHMISNHKGLVYFCSICHEIFSSNENLELHVNTHLTNQIACKECGLVVSTKRSLEKHLTIHGIYTKKERVKHYVCNVCNEFFKDLNDLSKHMLTHKSIMFSCKVCKFWCDSEVIFQKHMNKHNDDNQVYSCVKCERTFPTLNDLNFHKKSSKCSNNKQNIDVSRVPFECNVCGLRCETNYNLQKHMSAHANKMYSCEICGKVYNYNKAIVKHILQHNVDPAHIPRFLKELSSEESATRNETLMGGETSENENASQAEESGGLSCRICGKSYHYRGGFNNHMRLVHDIQPPRKPDDKLVPPGHVFSCEICGKDYQYESSLANHMRDQHGNSESGRHRARKTVEGRARRRRPFRCDLCGQRYQTNAGLMTHVRFHTGQRYPCKICGKVFSFSTSFFKHLRVHNMEPSDVDKSRRELPSVEDIVECNSDSLKCDVCGVRFINKEELLKHRRTHKPKIVRCKICGKCYRNRASLSKHLGVHNATPTMP